MSGYAVRTDPPSCSPAKLSGVDVRNRIRCCFPAVWAALLSSGGSVSRPVCVARSCGCVLPAGRRTTATRGPPGRDRKDTTRATRGGWRRRRGSWQFWFVTGMPVKGRSSGTRPSGSGPGPLRGGRPHPGGRGEGRGRPPVQHQPDPRRAEGAVRVATGVRARGLKFTTF